MSDDPMDEKQSENAALRERGEKLQAQAGAWCQVFDALRELVPEFTDMAPSGVGCAMAAIRGLHERAEKVKRERDEAQRAVRAWAAKLNPMEHVLEAAREDIKALATVLRAQTLGRSVPIYCDEQLAAWQRIRDRKLLEVSDGE